jgi:hypothetical protein
MVLVFFRSFLEITMYFTMYFTVGNEFGIFQKNIKSELIFVNL